MKDLFFLKERLLPQITILLLVIHLVPLASAETSNSKKKFPQFNLASIIQKEEFAKNNIFKKSKVTVVNFWASWCSPCKVELPFLDKLYKKHKNSGLNIIGFNIDDAIKPAKDYLEKHPTTFAHYYDEKQKVTETFNISRMPSNIVVSSDGEILWIKAGFNQKKTQEFEEKILSLLKSQK